MKEINQEFSFLFGKQHCNRLARGVRFFILGGRYEGYYSTIVGHGFGVDIDSIDPPILNILLTNSILEPQVWLISQHLV